MADVLYATRFGSLSSVKKVSGALKKKIFSGYFVVVTELDAKESYKEYVKAFRAQRLIGTAKDTTLLYRIELWGPDKRQNRNI